MIISKKYKFIFIHIPKTGGCSVESALMNHLGKEDLITDRMNYQDKKINAKFCDIPHHITLRDFHHLTHNRYKDYYKFSFVRNPYDRLVSMYSFYSQLKRRRIGESEIEKFNNWLLDNSRGNIINPKLGLKAQNQWKNIPQIEWVINNDNKIDVDFIGKIETFDSDLLTIGRKIGINIDIIPHKNKSKHSHYSNFFNAETKRQTEKKYMDDFKKFNYTWSTGKNEK
jgi:hypothetical protein